MISKGGTNSLSSTDTFCTLPLRTVVVFFWFACFAFAMGNTFSRQSAIRNGGSGEEVDKLYPPHLKLCMLQIIHRHGHRTPVAAESIVPWFPNGWPLCTAGENTRHALLVSQEHRDHPIQQQQEQQQNMHSPQLESKPSFRYFDVKFEHPHVQTDSPHALEHFFKVVVDAAKNVLHTGQTGATDTREAQKGICYHGQLTDNGRNALKALGSRIRALYTERLKFLSSEYNPTECYFRSTDYARTIESLQSLVVGLFPSVSNNSAESNISINVRKNNNETMHDNSLCNWLRQFARTYRANYRAQNKELIERLQKRHIQFSKTGLPEDIKLHSLWDFFSAYSQHGFRIPCKVTHKDYEELRDFAYKEEYGHFYENRNTLKYTIGKFLRELKTPIQTFIKEEQSNGREKKTIELSSINDNVEMLEITNKTTNPSPTKSTKKLYVYSGHDATLVPLLSSLGILNSNSAWPPFASNVIIELFEDKRQGQQQQSNTTATTTNNNPYFVRVKYQEKPVTIPECKAFASSSDESLCPVDEFFKIIDRYYPNDYKEQCAQLC